MTSEEKGLVLRLLYLGVKEGSRGATERAIKAIEKIQSSDQTKRDYQEYTIVKHTTGTYAVLVRKINGPWQTRIMSAILSDIFTCTHQLAIDGYGYVR